MDLPDALAPLAFLVGTWKGEGRGAYPTISPFDYGEEVTFACPGKPFLAYRQRTWALADGAPLHAESGYWRLAAPDRVEVVLAHPFGATEVLEGHLEGTTVRLASRHVGLTSTAKRITAVERDLDVDGERLGYRVRMTAVGEPLTHHLEARLRRLPERTA